MFWEGGSEGRDSGAVLWLSGAAWVLAVGRDGAHNQQICPRPGEQLLHSVAKEGAEWKRKKVGDTNLAVSSNNRKPQLCAHRGEQEHTEHTPVPCRDACQTGFIDSLNREG